MLRFDRRLLLNVDWILVATAAFIIALSVLSLWSLAPGRGGGDLLLAQDSACRSKASRAARTRARYARPRMLEPQK